MKHFIITGLVLTALFGSQVSYAQSRQTFEDDIYYNSKSQPKSKTKSTPSSTTAIQQAEPVTTNSTSGNSAARYTENSTEEYQNSTSFQTHTGTYFQTYETGDYTEEEDNYQYTTQINRFYYPWYDQPYWSACYAPYGYNPWYAPGFSFGIGFGFGYGYGGMYMGFGYPYYPYYPPYWGGGYPYYPYGGYCGYGGGYYPGGGYCGGYYNSYPVSYGPRYSSNTTRNDYAHGYRPTRNTTSGEKAPVTTSPVNSEGSSFTSSGVRSERSGNSTVRAESNSAPVPVFNDSRTSPTSPTMLSSQPAVSNGASSSYERPGRAGATTTNPGYSTGDTRNESANVQQAQTQSPRENRGFFGGRTRSETVRSVESTPRSQPSYSQPSYSQPRMERSASPRSAPSSSGSFGGSRGGSSGGGSGSFGGGRR